MNIVHILLLIGGISSNEINELRMRFDKSVKSNNTTIIISQDEDDLEFSMDIPEGLFEFSEDWKSQKYTAGSSPDWVYGNNDGSVSIGISFAIEEMVDDDLPDLLISSRETLIKSGVEWIGNEFKSIHGNNSVIMKFYSASPDGPIWNFMIGMVHDGYLTLMTFNCMKEQMPEWESELEKAALSVEIK